MDAPVLVEVTEGVATVTLNRPAVYNALTRAAKELLAQILREVAADDDVRAVVLTGAGKGFCVGQDLSEGDLSRSAPERMYTVAEHYVPLATLLAEMDKPVIAAINGPVAGAGLSLALAADFRIAAERASFTTAFAAIALCPDTGMSWQLPRLVGLTKATELLMFSPTLRAPEALQIGLVNKVVPDSDLAATVTEMASRLAQGPTGAYASIRALLRYSGQHSLADTMRLEHELITVAGASVDHAEAVQAFLDKRKAVFTGR
ncbi:MAG: enoyl-CoA hydratase/isomerase family protein [Sporichthyaceae bacterium]